MADLDHWAKEDDDLVRGALASLREDVHAEPLPEPAFVRARAGGSGRRTAAFWAAGVAAAAVAIAAVGFGALGRDNANAPIPGGSVSVTTPAPTPSGSVSAAAQSPEDLLLQNRSAWPIGQEWKIFLGLPKTPVVQPQPAGDFMPVCGPAALPAKAKLAADLVVVGDPAKPDQTLAGIQRHITFPNEAALRDGFNAMSSAISKCDVPGATSSDVTMEQTSWNGIPQQWWWTVNDQQRGYMGLATAGSELIYLEVHGEAAMNVPYEGFAHLLTQAQRRLELYGATTPATSVSPLPGTSTSTASTGAPSTATPKASTTPPSGTSSSNPLTIGPNAAHLLPDLFLSEAEWTEGAGRGIQGGVLVHGPGHYEGSAAVIECDPDTTPDGTFGIQRARKESDGTYVGVQRIRLFTGTQDAIDTNVAAYMDRIRTALDKGCTSENTKVTATKGPADDTWKVVTTFNDGTAPLTDWVLLLRPMKSGLVSTIAITSPSGITDDASGFAALTRLLEKAGARQ